MKSYRSISKTKAPKHDKWIRRQKKQGMILPGTLKTIKKTPLIKTTAMQETDQNPDTFFI